ncbi:MAG: hypothetical protein Q9222_002424 [Ikaeria aurantiellina]
MATTTLTLSCACKQIKGALTFSSSLLPLALDFCHCFACRHVTGQLSNSKFIAPQSSGNASSLKIIGEPKAFKTSDHLTRYFCGNCGASIYNHDAATGNYNIASGVLDKSEGLLTFRQHIYAVDTKDGGLSSWLDGLTWAGEPEKSEKIDVSRLAAAMESASEAKKSSQVLKCHCQCGGVQFNITRPDRESRNVFSPLPDLMVPYHLPQPQKNPGFAWWLRANGTKYFAGTCACDSCRLSTGYDIQAWAFVPKTNIRQMNGEEMNYEMGTLKRYVHSRRAEREFCGTCGATVFWHCDERPGIIDVSAGLLDAEEGARAEDWLEWATERVSFEECAQNKTLVASVSEGLRRWEQRQK